MARYRRSGTPVVRLPHPLVSERRYAALSERRRELVRRSRLLTALVPVLLVLGAVIDPLAAQAAVGALLLPTAGLAVHDRRAARRLDEQRQVRLRGGAADAWADWLAARDALAALPHATDARASLAVTEDRMHSLVLALADSTSPDTSDTREALYRAAATAVALADAARGDVLGGRAGD